MEKSFDATTAATKSTSASSSHRWMCRLTLWVHVKVETIAIIALNYTLLYLMNDISLSSQRMASAPATPDKLVVTQNRYMNGKNKKREKRKKKESMLIRHEEKMLSLCLKATQMLWRIDCVDTVCEFNFVFDGNPLACSETISNCG